MKKIKKGKNLYYFVLLGFILSIIYSICMIVYAPSEEVDTLFRQKSDYVLMLLQCILGIFAMNLPSFIKKKFNITIPTNTIIAYLIFLYSYC